jgi:integrase/recombinase XerD
MTLIAPHMTAFLRQRMAIERRASPHTCATYAHAFRLLFEFASQRLHVAPSQLHLEQLDVPLIVDFLDHLSSSRGNGPATRNARLVAIKSFMRFVEYREPSALEQVHQVLAIPLQKTDRRIVSHLTTEESQAVLDAPDPNTRLGIRDRAMLHLGIAGGLRVSELVGLWRDEVSFDGRYVDLRVRGKGRKERALRLWASVATCIRAWLALRGDAAVPELFLNAWGQPMTRSGFAGVLRKHVAIAATRCRSLGRKSVSPHSLRHTCAMNILAATKDIRKVSLWLGHASTQTAEAYYLSADPTEKLDVLGALKPPMPRPGKFSPQDELIAMLTES